MVERQEAAAWYHTSARHVKPIHFWISEVAPDLWSLTEIDSEGVESYVDALSGDFSQVAQEFDRRFPGRTLRAAWSDGEAA